MADYNSNYTGAEVDAAIAKTQALESATDINNAIAPTSATAGDVWTADGAGGAAWVTPSGGGGTQWYDHFYRFSVWGDSHIYTTKSTACTTLAEINTMFFNYPAHGHNSNGELILSTVRSGDNVYFIGVSSSTGTNLIITRQEMTLNTSVTTVTPL